MRRGEKKANLGDELKTQKTEMITHLELAPVQRL